jgi:signal recognition particle subunit SRP68
LTSHVEALSLLSRAASIFTPSLALLSAASIPSPTAPPTIDISPASASFLAGTLDTELQRHRALVEIATIIGTTAKLPSQTSPLVETLEHYPPGGEVDLSLLVTYPPQLEAVPVKPLFFDVAWNYIEYPGRSTSQAPQQQQEQEPQRPASQAGEKQEAKKGWFGFGRS